MSLNFELEGETARQPVNTPAGPMTLPTRHKVENEKYIYFCSSSAQRHDTAFRRRSAANQHWSKATPLKIVEDEHTVSPMRCLV
jgi:hypothetical protein